MLLYHSLTDVPKHLQRLFPKNKRVLRNHGVGSQVATSLVVATRFGGCIGWGRTL